MKLARKGFGGLGSSRDPKTPPSGASTRRIIGPIRAGDASLDKGSNQDLSPMAGDPDPAAVAPEPVTFHPDCGRARSNDPTTGDPDVVRAAPTPVAARPGIVRARRNGLHFRPHGGRFLSDIDVVGRRRSGQIGRAHV